MGRIWNSTLERKTPLRSNSRLSRNTRLSPVNRERRDREWKRAYGSEERVKAVQDMGCLVPGCERRAENAHLPGAGGMGYKGDADTIVNLCGDHHRTADDSLHELGSVERFDEAFGTDLRAAAERVEGEWQRIQSEEEG